MLPTVSCSGMRRRRMLHCVLPLREPCAGKLACTVLRGRGSSNTPLLPDTIGGSPLTFALAPENGERIMIRLEIKSDFENAACRARKKLRFRQVANRKRKYNQSSERVRHEIADVLLIPFLINEERKFNLSCCRQFLTPTCDAGNGGV